MGLSQQDAISQYGTEAYTGWGETEAAADAKSKGLSGGGGGGGTVDSILNSAISSLSQYFPKKVTPYDQVNPFFFDEALAKEASTAEYAPYYQELLTDYTSTVEKNKSRSQQDLQSTLEQLNAGKEYYMGNERRLLDRAVKSTNEGFAGRGLYMSGARGKDLADLQTQYSADTGNYLSQYNYNTSQAKLGTERKAEDLTTAQSNYSRDIDREKQLAITSGVLTRKGEARDEYEISRRKYMEEQQYG